MRAILLMSLTLAATAFVQGEEVPLDRLPKAVKEAAQKRFPKAKITEASKAKDGEHWTYEVSLKHEGKKIDVSLAESGAITLIEQELAFENLPKAVAKTFAEKFPGAKYEIIESVTKVSDGKETLEYYESTLVAADTKKWEVEVHPDGKFKSSSEVKASK